MAVDKNSNTELPYDPAIPLLSMYPKELNAGAWTDMYTPTVRAISFTIVKRWKQPNVHLQMNKQYVVHTHDGILFNLKKKWNSDSCYNMDEP